MKWFKHDTNAHNDKRLTKVIMKYGLKGYGFYWYCLEKIGLDIETDKWGCCLDADTETLAWDLQEDIKWIQEILDYYIELGLFTKNKYDIYCEKMLTRLDRSTSENPEFKKMLKNHSLYNGCTENVQDLSAEKKRKEENTKEKKNKRVSPSFRNKVNTKRWAEYSEQVKEVMEYYNIKRKRNLVPHTENYVKLLGILFETGFTVDQCKSVIIHRWEKWRTDEKMAEYHRPETLFAYENFQKYLPEALEYIEKKKEIQRPKKIKKNMTPIERSDPELAKKSIAEMREIFKKKEGEDG